MAWYNGTFSCGHEGRVNVIGKIKDRQWKIDRAFNNMCPECYQKWLQEEHERKNKEALEEAKEMDLPELTGTEKQVAWANTLRKNFIDTVEKRIENLKEKSKPKKAKRYSAIPGIHVTAEDGRDQANAEMRLTQRKLLDSSLTQQQKAKLEEYYKKLKQQVIMFESQLDLTNQTSTQNINPYYIP